VCGTAIECPMSATLRFHLHKGRAPSGPAIEVPATSGSLLSGSRRFVTVGTNADLMEAARDALRRMLDWMEQEFLLSRAETYILSSLIVDLVIAQVVNTPQWTVTASLPLDVFLRRG